MPRKPTGRPLTPEQQALALTCLPACHRYAGDYAQSQEDREDLLSLAHLALTNAARHFDPNRGFKFSTYAINAIKHAMHSEFARRTRKSRTGTRVSMSHLPQDTLPCLMRPDDPLGVDARDEIEVKLQKVREAIRNLPERDLEIVRLKMSGATLKDIGEQFGVSKERVRQVILQCVDRIRRNCGVATA